MLYIVSTPIGNLQDITIRAIETLKIVDYVYAEDSRVSRKLLEHYNIQKPILSYREQNHKRVCYEILTRLLDSQHIAILSDAGTPTISDPGTELISFLRENGYKDIVSIPGPTAFVATASISGFTLASLTYIGFLPKGMLQRRKTLEKFYNLGLDFVFYESPNRILDTVNLIIEMNVSVKLCIANDLTKLYERVYLGTPHSVKAELESAKWQKGEYTVLVKIL